ncbi:MAG: hypothetical protein KME15_16495 [Drouetiella hepatica Uher 2000/2452]|uniref:Uncharacterized protein n=1 Tax=Drouetiella hepatica Uher 2000/2452 TaxID=904376 RepID=A0A951UN24_9CYAN|nr:hypothetical protein [Drouetiella hepatica Uher 2000/2452]
MAQEEKITYVQLSEIVKLGILDTEYAANPALLNTELEDISLDLRYIQRQIDRFSQNPTQREQFDTLYRIATRAEGFIGLSPEELDSAFQKQELSGQQILTINNWLDQTVGARIEVLEKPKDPVQSLIEAGLSQETAMETARIQGIPKELRCDVDEAKLTLFLLQANRDETASEKPPLEITLNGKFYEVEVTSYISERTRILLWDEEGELDQIVTIDSTNMGYLPPSVCVVHSSQEVMDALLKVKIIEHPQKIGRGISLCEVNNSLLDEE